MAKPVILYTVRSGWPSNLKSDCEYFNITYNQLAFESKLSRYRISAIANKLVLYKEKDSMMKELMILTHAFDRIIEDRRRKAVINKMYW